MWGKKPLIMVHSGTLDKKDGVDAEIADFFTFRQNEPTYFKEDTSKLKEQAVGISRKQVRQTIQ